MDKVAAASLIVLFMEQIVNSISFFLHIWNLTNVTILEINAIKLLTYVLYDVESLIEQNIGITFERIFLFLVIRNAVSPT